MINRSGKTDMFSFMKEYEVAAGATIEVEGKALVKVLEEGKKKVALSTGDANEEFAGFSSLCRMTPGNEVIVKNIKVAAVVDLLVTNVTSFSFEGFTKAADQASVAAGKVFVDLNKGFAYFDAADLDKVVKCTLRHDMSHQEAIAKYREGHFPNSTAFSMFGKVTTLAGKGIIYTDQFDIESDWSDDSKKVRLGADGMVTKNGSGTVINASVVALPTAECPFLGLECNI